MRRVMIGSGLALIASVIWLGMRTPSTTEGEPAKTAPGDGQASDV